MKVFVFVVIAVFLVQLADARLIDIEYIRAYINTERVDDVDESGGTIDGSPKDELKFVVKMSNLINHSIESRLRVVIYDVNGNDVDKTGDWYDIPKNEDKTGSITITLPDTIKDGEYDLLLRLYAQNSNSTEDDIDYVLNVDTAGETTGVAVVDKLTNFTRDWLAKDAETKRYWNDTVQYAEYWGVCQGEKRMWEERAHEYEKEVNETSLDYQTCDSERKSLEENKMVLDSKIRGMITTQECEIQKTDSIQQAKSDQQSTFIMLVVAAGLVYFFIIKPRQRVDVPVGRTPPRVV